MAPAPPRGLSPGRRCCLRRQSDFETCSGFPLRLVEAIFSSSFSLIDSIDLEAPFSLLFGVSALGRKGGAGGLLLGSGFRRHVALSG